LCVAGRIFWFGTPEDALEFPLRFLNYVIAYTSDEDIEILMKLFSDDDFKATLDDPAPGTFDQSSGGLNGSMQHLLKVFLYESMRLISFAGVNSNKTKPCLGFD
jgi:hypothetical protein